MEENGEEEKDEKNEGGRKKKQRRIRMRKNSTLGALANPDGKEGGCRDGEQRGQVSLMDRLSTQLDHRLSSAATHTKRHTQAHTQSLCFLISTPSISPPLLSSTGLPCNYNFKGFNPNIKWLF